MQVTQDTMQDEEDDDDVLLPIERIPKTSTEKLGRIQKKLAEILSQDLSSSSALLVYARRENDAITSELGRRDCQKTIEPSGPDQKQSLFAVKRLQNSKPELDQKPPRRSRRRKIIPNPQDIMTVVVAGGNGGFVRRAKEAAVHKAMHPVLSPAEMLKQRRQQRRAAAIQRLKERREARMSQRLRKRTLNRNQCYSDSESVSDDSSTEDPHGIQDPTQQLTPIDHTGTTPALDSKSESSSLSASSTPEKKELICDDAQQQPSSETIQDNELHTAAPTNDTQKPTGEHGDDHDDQHSRGQRDTSAKTADEDDLQHQRVSALDATHIIDDSTLDDTKDNKLYLTSNPNNDHIIEAPSTTTPSHQPSNEENDDEDKHQELTCNTDADVEASSSAQHLQQDTQIVQYAEKSKLNYSQNDDRERSPKTILSDETSEKCQRQDSEAIIEAQAAVDTTVELMVNDRNASPKESAEIKGTTAQKMQKRVMVEYFDVHPDWSTIFPRWSILGQVKGIESCSDRRNSATKLYRGDVRVAGARQWRLYAAYEAIMNDYAAVFSVSCNEKSELDKNAAVYRGTSRSLHFRVNSSRPEVFDIVTRVMTSETSLKDDWVELPSGLGLKTTWNLLWTWSRPRINYDHLLVWQKVNHYPGSRHLTRKDLLARCIGRIVELAPVDSLARTVFDILPQTYIMPQDYARLVKAFVEEKKFNQEVLWIIKPVGLSRGRGISVVSRIEDVRYSEQVVVQKYIPQPLLLKNHKFDLRLYVVVTSFSPLEAFIYHKGFARVASRPFSENASTASDKLMHLTNASIQDKALSNTDTACCSAFENGKINEIGGSKCTLDFLWRQLKVDRPDLDVDTLWNAICDLVLASLVCVDTEIPHQVNSFELFGYDVLIDSNFRPWLLEVNASPSMARATTLDAFVKESLIRDTVHLIDPVPYDRTKLVQVLDRRLAADEQAPISRQAARSALASPAVLNNDLNVILNGAKPRRYGELPRKLGGFARLAPSQRFDKFRRLKRTITKKAAPSARSSSSSAAYSTSCGGDTV